MKPPGQSLCDPVGGVGAVRFVRSARASYPSSGILPAAPPKESAYPVLPKRMKRSVGTIVFGLGQGNFYWGYTIACKPSALNRTQLLAGASVKTELFTVDTPHLNQYVSSLEGWTGEMEISGPMIISRKSKVRFAGYNHSGLKIFEFEVVGVKCLGIQVGSAIVQGTLIRNLNLSNDIINRQLRYGAIGR